MRNSALFAATAIALSVSLPAAAQLQLNPSGQVELKHASPAWQTILAAKAGGETKSGKRQYVFQCSFEQKQNELLDALNGSKPKTQKIIAIEDQPAKVEQLSQRPFVTGALEVEQKTKAGEASYQPVLTALEHGNSVEVTIKSLDKEHVQLDATFAFTRIAEPVEVAVGERNTQAVMNNTVSQRLVRSVKLGEKFNLVIPGLDGEQPTVIEYSIVEL